MHSTQELTGSRACGAAGTLSRRAWRLPLAALWLLFAASLPFANPYVHGDGVGYYAYARALLIQGNLRFEEDWRRANEGFSASRVGAGGSLQAEEYTETGHLSNIFSVGPAILWSPFLSAAHVGVLVARQLGSSIPADGFSWPYRVAMAFGTACLGFFSLLLSYDLARKYAGERWALLATLGIWTASSLPVYMYFNPSWSHAHSALVVALFLWFWERTRPERTLWQWAVLGLCGGLMIDTYFPNGVVLLIPAIESLRGYLRFLGVQDFGAAARQLGRNSLFLAALVAAALPTFVTRAIVFGGPFRFGAYGTLPWDWKAPHRWDVLFSSDHGLLSWTPLLALAVLGLLLATGAARELSLYCGIVVLAFYYVISSYPYWDGMSSFGNRFFISLTPVFILGLALLFNFVGQAIAERGATIALAGVVGIAALWNGGLIFQWGTQMIPARGPVSWSQVAHNQFVAVPVRVAGELEHYFLRRDDLMQGIEAQDMERRRQAETSDREP